MVTSAQINLLHNFYVGYFGRAADPEGLSFWIKSIDAGETLDTIASAFAAAKETEALYPYLTFTNDVTQASSNTYNNLKFLFINSIYQNLFNRESDDDGLTFWTRALDEGRISSGDMIRTLISEALTTDKDILDNKAEAGEYFTQQANKTSGYEYSPVDGKAALQGVTKDTATVTASKEATDISVSNTSKAATDVSVSNSSKAATDVSVSNSSKAATEDSVSNSSTASKNFALTNGVDDEAEFTGSVDGDTFTASGATLQSGDALNGGAGFDTLSIVDITNASETGLVISPFLTGFGCRTYAAIFSFCAGVIPPMPIFGRSTARQGIRSMSREGLL